MKHGETIRKLLYLAIIKVQNIQVTLSNYVMKRFYADIDFVLCGQLRYYYQYMKVFIEVDNSCLKAFRIKTYQGIPDF